MATEDSARRKRRIPTGIKGLDTILGGGLFRGGVYIVRGAPGAGKTILGNQVCFSIAKHGGTAAYVTLLAEQHARMMMHLEGLEFFDEALIGERVHYLSGFSVLESGGLRAVLELLRRELRARKVTMLVVDGLVALNESGSSRTDLKKFLHELQLHAELTRCTVLLLTGGDETIGRPENTMVDGIFELGEKSYGVRTLREIRVPKFRGSAQLMGGHTFEIRSDGIVIYPRTEALYATPSREDRCRETRVSIGIPTLDEMLRGGLPGGSTTMLVGPSGAGKTTLGLHYLAATPKTSKALYFGFYETPPRLMSKARHLGLKLEQRIARGEIDVVWQPSTEQAVDALTDRLLDALSRTGASRLFIDGLDGFQRATIQSERVHHVFTALANELRTRGVTTVYSYEVPKFIGPDLDAPITGVSALVENLIYLRFVELRSQLYRMLSVLKVRDSEYDASLREFCITSRGIRLESTFTSAEAILTGSARSIEPADTSDVKKHTAKSKGRGSKRR